MTSRRDDGLPRIGAGEVRRRTPMPALIDALRDAFRGDVEAPPRSVYRVSDTASLLIMPAWRNGGRSGIKIVNVDTARNPAVTADYVLSDAAGRIEAVLDGAMLTARRTAAASALAADCLAKPDAARLLMIGTGTLAPHLVEAHASVRALESVLIWGRDPARAAQLADTLCAQGLAAAPAESLAAAVSQCDIVSVATTSSTALVEGRLLSRGAHVDLVGAFRPDMCEADPETFARAEVYVDTREGALAEAGDLLQAIEAGAMTAADIRGSLAELCSGRLPGRRDAGAITLFKSVGTALEDLACAELVVGGHRAS